ncbi:MAG: JAB domain-containing protein, partial [Gemmatimonadota bacterium]
MERALSFAAGAAERVRAAIARARGNEVCFAARVGDGGEVHEPRVIARGHRGAVLAAARGLEPGTLIVHNHPSGELEPSDPDLEVAAELHDRGLGLAITDNEARELYVVVEPAAAKEYEPIDEDAVAALLSPGGPVSRAHPTYEDRPMQRAMARRVARAYNEGGIEVAEAGTGTGKSIAYLVPAIRWAGTNGERTVVSTNTINLQEQLVRKDLPFLRRALGEPFRFALVKGRRNYISIRRAKLAAATAGTLFEDGRRAELDAIVEWTETTRDGSLQDLPFAPSTEVWDEVASESDVCLRAKCPHFERCFYQRARRDAATADVLVVNHHLLFSDIAVRRAQGNYTAPAVLPPYRRVVLDEAHNLEDAATSHLGARVSRRGLNRLFGRLDRRGKGVLRAVEDRLRAGRDDLLQRDALGEIEERIRPAVLRAREVSTELFDRLDGLVERTTSDGVLRLGSDFAAEPEWAAKVQPAQEDLTVVLDRLAGGLERLREKILVDERWTEALAEQLLEVQALAGRTRAALDAMRLALAPPSVSG